MDQLLAVRRAHLAQSVRSPACRARFNALVRADPLASGARAPGVTVAPPTPLFMGEDRQLPHGEASADVLSRTVEEHTTGPDIEPESLEGVDASDLLFSAGIPPGLPKQRWWAKWHLFSIKLFWNQTDPET